MTRCGAVPPVPHPRIQPRRRGADRAIELRFRYRAAVVRHARARRSCWMTQRRRLGRVFWLELAARRVSTVREGVQVAIEPGNTVVLDLANASLAMRWSCRRRQWRPAKAVGLGRGIVHVSHTKGNIVGRHLGRGRTAPAQAPSRTRRHPAATRGSSPREITRISAWRLAEPRARNCASTCRRACEAHGVTPEQLENLRGHRLPLRTAGDAYRQ